MLAALNNVQGTYLHAPTKEKVYTTTGLEFGAGKVRCPVLIVRTLYGLNSTGEVESLQHGFQHTWLAHDEAIPVSQKRL
jgi:hypothetical protein